MNYLISFYVGTERDKYNERMNPGFVAMGLEDIRTVLLKCYDGYTEINTTGGWLNNSGNAVTEDGVKFEVLVEYASEVQAFFETHDNAARIAAMLNQASVLYSLTPVTRFATAP